MDTPASVEAAKALRKLQDEEKELRARQMLMIRTSERERERTEKELGTIQRKEAEASRGTDQPKIMMLREQYAALLHSQRTKEELAEQQYGELLHQLQFVLARIAEQERTNATIL